MWGEHATMPRKEKRTKERRKKRIGAEGETTPRNPHEIMGEEEKKKKPKEKQKKDRGRSPNPATWTIRWPLTTRMDYTVGLFGIQGIYLFIH